MTTLVLTAIGDDRPGLVSALSAAIDDHGGSWVDSSLALLAGKFAGIVLVEVTEEHAPALTEAVSALSEQVGLRVDVTPAGAPAAPTGAQAAATGARTAADGETLQLHLLGQDRTGMVREVASALASAGATIDDLRSWTRDAPEGGGVLFEAEAAVRLPAGADAAAVREALERIAAELMVDLDLADIG